MTVKQLVNKLGLPRLIIILFVLILILASSILGMNTPYYLGASLTRFGMHAILVLAMVPPLVAGVGLNFSIPICIVAGLFGGMLSMEWGLTGFAGVFTAMAIGGVLGALIGYGYCLLLNRIKGSEMMIGTYAGYSVVSFMCMIWLALPVTNEAIRWTQGTGVRTITVLDDFYAKVFDNFLSFQIGSMAVPTGLLLVVAFFCFLVWLLLRSKTGMMMKAVGESPTFARSVGVNVNRVRCLSMALSGGLAAVGIVVYSQSYQFYQFYNAPLNMAFAEVAAILIGGATHKKASVSNVIVGTLLFQGLLTFALPVTNQILPDSSISEIVRIVVSNGIILYALTKAGDE